VSTNELFEKTFFDIMKRPTQKDVALKAGVSRSTVSYVLNDQIELKVPISEETRQRVLLAIQELGYEPDVRAQSLRGGHSKTVAVIIPVIQNPYFWQTLSGISDALQEAGYSLHLLPNPKDPKQGVNIVRELSRQRADGFICLAAVKNMLPALSDYLRKSGQPVVEITAIEGEFDQVIHGYSSGTRELMNHLLALGHRRIGFIYGVTQEVQGLDRLQVYRQVLKEVELTPYEVHCGDQLHEAYQAAYQVLDRSDRPTALMVINDMLAIGVMRAAAELSLHIPDDLSVAGFDDISFSSYLVPSLTTVSGKAEESGRDAVRLLLNRFEEPEIVRQLTRTGEQLIVRESTGLAKGM
jgi:LacI family transcriptional regulator